MYGGYDQYTNGGYGQPVQHQQQWGQPAHQQVPYGGDNGFNNNYKVGFNAPPAGPPQSYSQQYSDYDQNQQFSANDGHSTGYYGGNSPQPAADEPSSTEDLPYPWVREFDETYMQVYYVNPSSNPPFTSWTHPNLPTGTQHPEQIQTRREAQQLAAEEEVSPGGQPGERGFVTKAAGAFVGYKVLKHLLNKTNNGHQGGSNYGGNYGGSHGNGGVQWGTALTGAAAGAGGAMLLGKLFGGKNSNKYGHQMGRPPW